MERITPDRFAPVFWMTMPVSSGSTTARGDIWIARAAGQCPWLLSITHAAVVTEIAIPPSDSIPGPGFATYAVPTLGRPLFPGPEASVVGEKLYISSPRALSELVPGAVILFYESIGNNSGRGAAVAAGQITRTAVRENSEIDIQPTRRGVLNSEEVRDMSSRNKVGLTFFNQLFRFERPVALTRLRELGCDDGTSFVTARQIGEGAASIIIEEGKGSVRLS